MPSARLTDRFIRSAKCPQGEQLIDYADLTMGGLTLRVNAGGRKVFNLRYRFSGRRKRIALGIFGDESNQILLKDARKKATDILARVQAGDDPALEREMERADSNSPNTVDDVIELYKSRLRRRGRRESYLYDIEMRLKLHVSPAIGKLPIEAVTPADIAKVMRPLETAGKATTHNRVLTMIRPLFELAQCDDPSKCIEKLPEEAKEEWFSLAQLAKIWVMLDNPDSNVHPLTAKAIQLSMLTLKRAGECAGAELSEFDGNLWRIPSKRMKGRRSEVVPLSDAALELIDEIKNHPLRPETDWGFLFPSSLKTNAHMQRNAMSRAFPRTKRKAGFKNHAGTLHSLRHSGATLLASDGVSPYVISALLSHALTAAGVASVTSRYNMYDLLEERRAALGLWGTKILDSIRKQLDS